jgi:hypothetical protein
MAGLSRSIFSLLEVLTSSDLMQAFRLQGRDTLEIARYLAGDRGLILGGLAATAGPTGVSIAPGALLEPYAGVVSVPRADESSTILGLARAPVAVDVPALGVDTWYLVEARAAELDTNASRDIASQSLGTTSPATVLVQRDCSILARARVGTATALPAIAAGWQPIAAVLRRTTGAVLAADVYDLRTLFADLEIAGTERFRRQDYGVQITSAAPHAQLGLDVELVSAFGQRLTAQSPGLQINTLLEPGYTPLANSWAYLYLVTLGDVVPVMPTGRGLLILSDKPPATQGSRSPAASLTLPAPWGGLGATARATCFGCLRTVTSGGDSWASQSCVEGHYEILEAFAPYQETEGALVPLASVGPPPFLPLNARRATFSLRFGAVDASARTALIGSASGGAPYPFVTATVAVDDRSATTGGLWVRGTDPSGLLVVASDLATGDRLSLLTLDL